MIPTNDHVSDQISQYQMIYYPEHPEHPMIQNNPTNGHVSAGTEHPTNDKNQQELNTWNILNIKNIKRFQPMVITAGTDLSNQ